MTYEEANRIAIKTVLASKGYFPVKEKERFGMYYSPLRKENNASFKVDYALNLWRDFGSGEGGTTVDLIMKLNNCTPYQALLVLEEGGFASDSFSFQGNTVEPEPILVINKAETISNPFLIAYLRERKIPLNIAQSYCKEVHYSVNGKNYYAVGFQSDSGSYELSSKYFKGGSSPKAITTLDNKNDSCLVFEGFMDFLSYLTLEKAVKPVSSVCVLNSVNQLSKAMEFISRYNTIHVFTDNDEGGKRALKEIQATGKTVIDHSDFYKNYKDLNEYLQAQKPKQNQKIKRGIR